MLLTFVGRSSGHRRSAIIRITTHPCWQLLLPRVCPVPEVPDSVGDGVHAFDRPLERPSMAPWDQRDSPSSHPPEPRTGGGARRPNSYAEYTVRITSDRGRGRNLDIVVVATSV
jgi:hypothetical protein